MTADEPDGERPTHHEALCHRAALAGRMRRPQSRPYLVDTTAPCVLASDSAIAPRRRGPMTDRTLRRRAATALGSWGATALGILGTVIAPACSSPCRSAA